MTPLRDAKGRFVSKANTTNTEITTNKKENNTMTNKMSAKQERMNKLAEAGFNVDNFFNLNLQIPLGAEVKISVNGKEMTIGQPVPNNDIVLTADETREIVKAAGLPNEYDWVNDEIAQSIIEHGYVKNTRLFRRWIFAKTMSMLNYKNYRNSSRTGWECCMKDCYPYGYQFKMLVNEMNALAELQREDPKEFDLRTRFFNGEVLMATLYEYVYRLKKYIAKERKRNRRMYKNKEYVRLAKYRDVFVSELDTKVFNVINGYINNIKYYVDHNDYKGIYKALVTFMDEAYNKLPEDTTKCGAWKDAFKAAGAFYSLQNAIRFHEVTLEGCCYKYDSERKLYELLEKFKGEEWRLHKVLVDTIEANNFNLSDSIAAGHNAPGTSVDRRWRKYGTC